MTPADHEPSPQHLAERIAAAAIWIAVGVYFVVVCVRVMDDRDPDDFTVYYFASQRLCHGLSPYTAHDPSIGDSIAVHKAYKYAPAFALVVAPLTVLPMAAARAVWLLMSFAAMVGVVVCMRRLLASSDLSVQQRWWMTGLPVLLVVRYESQCLDLGQVSLLMLLLVVAAEWAAVGGRRILAGFSLAAAVLIKIIPAGLLLYWLTRRDRRPAAVFAVQ